MDGILIIDKPEGITSHDVVARMRALAGMVETGYFPTEATEAIIAGADGIRRMRRP